MLAQEALGLNHNLARPLILYLADLKFETVSKCGMDCA